MDIKTSRNLSINDLKSVFNAMPEHYINSFLRSLNHKRENLPSKGLLPKKDKSGMMLTDIKFIQNPVPNKSVFETSRKQNKIFLDVKLVLATGVPIPDKTQIPRD